MKNLDLFGWLLVFTIIGLTIAAIGTMDFSGAASIDEIAESLQKPLEIKNWHYAVAIILLWSKK